MDKLAYTALSAMQSQAVVRAAITNELANVSTVGFKKSFQIASAAVKIEGPGFETRFQPGLQIILPFCDVIVSDTISDMVRDKLIESKYIAVDSGLHDDLNNRTEEFRKELMEQNKEIFEVDDNENFVRELEHFQMEQDAIKSKRKGKKGK